MLNLFIEAKKKLIDAELQYSHPNRLLTIVTRTLSP